GTHSLTTVARWLNLDYLDWFREHYPNEAKQWRVARRSSIVPTTLNSRKQKAKPIRVRATAQPTVATVGVEAVEYVSEVLTPDVIKAEKTLLVIAPVGMGKTTAIADYVKAMPPGSKRTGIAQFRLLTRTLAQALDFPHYEDADGAHQRSLAQLADLVSSVQSLHKFERSGGLVIGDEIEGTLRFISDSSTFKNNEALLALRAFKAQVKNADQFIGMDANTSEISIDWIESLRGKATVKRFSSPTQRGGVHLLKNEDAGIYQIGKLLKQRRGQVIVACSGEGMASQVAELHVEYKVLKITRDTSNTAIVKAASTSATVRGEYDLIVYDSSWGAGVDVSEPVYAQVCIFGRKPLAPEDALQLWGRVRHAKRRYAVVPADSDGYHTETADELLADKIRRECWTAPKVGMAPQITGEHLELAQLWSKFEARRRAESAQWRCSFVQHLQANGYSVDTNNAAAPAAFSEMLRAWRKTRKDRHWTGVQTAQGEALPTLELDRLRMNGVEITETLKLRNLRFMIELALAVDTVGEQDRDLMTEDNRKRLYRLQDLVGDEIEVLDADRQQAQEGRPLHKRRYSTLDRRAVVRLFELAGHSGSPEQQLIAFTGYFSPERAAADVEERYEALMSDRATRLFEALGHRGNNSRTVTGRCRWLMEFFGLKLKSKQRREKGAPQDAPRPMFYQIDADFLAYRLARARRAAHERLLSKNVQDQEECTFLDTPEAKYTEAVSIGSDRTEPPIKPAPRDWGGASRYNPFSKAKSVLEVD
ncbi:MAG: hypothetical protein ABI700_18410, partial [Chloroflexota bacterium]